MEHQILFLEKNEKQKKVLSEVQMNSQDIAIWVHTVCSGLSQYLG